MAGKTFLVSKRNKGLRNLFFLLAALIFSTSIYQFAEVYSKSLFARGSSSDQNFNEFKSYSIENENPVSQMTLEQLMEFTVLDQEQTSAASMDSKMGSSTRLHVLLPILIHSQCTSTSCTGRLLGLDSHNFTYPIADVVTSHRINKSLVYKE